MKVVEIFKSIDGEGIRAGIPVTFIRLFGCNLNCSYCDTRYGCEGDGYTIMSIPEIMDVVRGIGLKRITLTGGEPMIHPGVTKLLNALVEEGYDVNVETNGTQPPYRYKQEYIPDLTSMTMKSLNEAPGSIFYTMDWKCKSSDMEGKMNIDLVNELTSYDVLKFVVGSGEDMDGALRVIEEMTSEPQVFFSPVFGKIEPSQIVEFLLSKKLDDCRVQIQMHKVIWDPNKKGV